VEQFQQEDQGFHEKNEDGETLMKREGGGRRDTNEGV
jgi:hypothetical protein